MQGELERNLSWSYLPPPSSDWVSAKQPWRRSPCASALMIQAHLLNCGTHSMIQGQLFPLKMLILTWEAIIKFDRQTRTTQIPLLLRSKLKLMTSRTKNNGLQVPC